ncbi:MAG: hypothetical protein CL840_14700 [Crocinitomicaceae bacterium]|nr:hypothetical protein [Crocinitomicaceae bacterium]
MEPNDIASCANVGTDSKSVAKTITNKGLKTVVRVMSPQRYWFSPFSRINFIKSINEITIAFGSD